MAYDSPMEEALELWQEITGVRAGDNWRWKDQDFRQILAALKEALDVDTSDVTATLMLSAYVNDHFARKTVSVETLLSDPRGVADSLVKPRRLLEILNAPDVLERRESFVRMVGLAMEKYGAHEREDVKGLLADPDELAFLRRDALRSMSKLRVDQFLDGDAEAAGVRPVYYHFVHQWWNVNSMLEASARMAPGVSINLIRDPNEFESYFCFSIRNGARLFVLSDAPEHKHPLQPMMSRRPDRAMAERINRNWFPYDLMGAKIDEESRKVYFERSESTDVAIFQNEAQPLQLLSKLPPRELVWIAMMFELIVDRFWRRGYTAPELSYTAEMIRVQDRMLEAATRANLPVASYPRIDLAPIGLADITAASPEVEKAFGSRTDMSNRWIEERYGHLVSTESLNMLAAPEKHFAMLTQGNAIKPRHSRFEPSRSIMDADKLVTTVPVEKLSSTSFGSKESVVADRMFIARYNFAVQIDALARNEFIKRNDEALTWYRKRIDENFASLLAWTGERNYWFEDYTRHGHRKTGIGYHPDSAKTRSRPDRHFRSFNRVWRWDDNMNIRVNMLGSYYKCAFKDGSPLCVVNGTKATYIQSWCPATAEEAAFLAGCPVSDMPELMEHYDLREQERGNKLTDRTDPVEWAVHNPWADLDLRVSIPLSKRGLAKLDKEHVVPDFIKDRIPADAPTRDWTVDL
jgi:hypothetical protein